MRQRTLCHAILLLGLVTGSVLGIGAFFFAFSWGQTAFAVLRDYQQQERLLNVVSGAFIVIVLIVSCAFAWWIVSWWAGLLRHRIALDGSRAPLPDNLLALARFELVLLPLFGIALVLNIAFPALIALIAGMPLLGATAHQLPVAPSVVIVPGVFSAGITGLVLAALAVQRAFRLSGEEVRALFTRESH